MNQSKISIKRWNYNGFLPFLFPFTSGEHKQKEKRGKYLKRQRYIPYNSYHNSEDTTERFANHETKWAKLTNDTQSSSASLFTSLPPFSSSSYPSSKQAWMRGVQPPLQPVGGHRGWGERQGWQTHSRQSRLVTVAAVYLGWIAWPHPLLGKFFHKDAEKHIFSFYPSFQLEDSVCKI